MPGSKHARTADRVEVPSVPARWNVRMSCRVETTGNTATFLKTKRKQINTRVMSAAFPRDGVITALRRVLGLAEALRCVVADHLIT